MIIECNGRFYQLTPNKKLGGICDGYVEIPSDELKDYTCYDCPCRNRCEYAFNPYCTDGECLSNE